MFLLIHTMSITEHDYVIEAQYVHSFDNFNRMENARLLGSRLRIRLQAHLTANRAKLNAQRLFLPNIKSMITKKKRNIRHHLRTVKMYVRTLMNNQFVMIIRQNNRRKLLGYLNILN